MRFCVFLFAALLATQSAFAQIQVVSLATLDRIDVDTIAMRPTTTARVPDASVCVCGCLDGGVCSCPDCPSKARETLVVNRSKLLPDGSPDTLAPGIEKLFAV